MAAFLFNTMSEDAFFVCKACGLEIWYKGYKDRELAMLSYSKSVTMNPSIVKHIGYTSISQHRLFGAYDYCAYIDRAHLRIRNYDNFIFIDTDPTCEYGEEDFVWKW